MPTLSPIPLNPGLRPEASLSPSTKEPAGQRVDAEKLKKACSDFESIFITKLLKTMRQTVPRSGLFGAGTAQEMYQSLFDEEISKSLARHGGIGLGDMLFRSLSPKEENSPVPGEPTSRNLRPLGRIKGKEQ
jgi:Rod binding domain-containing protein